MYILPLTKSNIYDKNCTSNSTPSSFQHRLPMQLSMRQTYHLEQRVTQLLKQELTLQLRMVLEHLLAMLQHLIEKQAISHKQLGELQDAMAVFSEDDHTIPSLTSSCGKHDHGKQS